MKKLSELVKEAYTYLESKKELVDKTKEYTKLFSKLYTDLLDIISKFSVINFFTPNKINNSCKDRILKFGKDLIKLYPLYRGKIEEVDKSVIKIFSNVNLKNSLNDIFDMYDKACNIKQ